tara:strand:+ start:722 stop:1135 length:414 start_codon:yes stop_codon:yes gene_type:complete
MKAPFKLKYSTSPLKQKLNSPLKQWMFPTVGVLGINPGQDALQMSSGIKQEKKVESRVIPTNYGFSIENYMDSGETKHFQQESNYMKALQEHEMYLQDKLDVIHGTNPSNFKGEHSKLYKNLQETQKKIQMITPNVT